VLRIFFLSLILIVFNSTVFLFKCHASKTERILIYRTKTFGDLRAEEVLKEYLKALQERAGASDLQLEIRSLSEEIALRLLRSAEYIGIGEISLTLIRDALSIDWKVIVPGGIPYYFYVTGSVGKIEELIRATEREFDLIYRERPYVEKVRFEGLRRVGEDILLPRLKIRAGEPLDLKRLNDDLKGLYRLGYFETIEIFTERGERGIILVYKVKERDSIKEITFKGLKKGKKDDLARIIELKPGDIPTPEKLNKALENIKAYYEQLGFHNTEVTLRTEPVTPAQVNLIFEIKEGKKKYIKRIEFVGNRAFSERELKGYLSVSERSLFTPITKYLRYLAVMMGPEPKAEPGVYNLAYLYRDLGKIETAYKNRGFLEVKVGEPQVIEEEDGVIIRIPIEEGPQYRVRDIKIVQDLFPEEEIRKKLKTQPGKIFNLGALREDEVFITHLFTDYGYAYAKVLTQFERAREENLLDVIFRVEKGPVVFVNRIDIEGNTKTRDKVIRRELLIAEGWPYSGKRLEKSEERLRRLGFFEDVKIEKERGAKEEELNLKVKVKEALTGTFSIGAAYSSSEKFVFMTEIAQRNWLGKGQRVSVSAKLGTRSSRYAINFFDPYFRDTRYSLGWSLYDYVTKYDDFTKDSSGGSLRFGYIFTPNLSAYIGYRYDDSVLKDIAENASYIIKESAKIHVTSSFETGVVYDSRNRFFMPTKGWYHELGLSYAGGFLGGDARFLKFTAEHQVYFPIRKLTGHVVLGYGYITEGSATKVPVYERFFLGGISSVRGYKYGDISPRDETTKERIGGTRMFYNQFEILFPLISAINLQGVVFYDMGTVWSQKYKFDTSEIRKSIGLGVRWLSPLGPLRIEWGYNIDKKPGEDKSNLNFQIGGFF